MYIVLLKKAMLLEQGAFISSLDRRQNSVNYSALSSRANQEWSGHRRDDDQSTVEWKNFLFLQRSFSDLFRSRLASVQRLPGASPKVWPIRETHHILPSDNQSIKSILFFRSYIWYKLQLYIWYNDISNIYDISMWIRFQKNIFDQPWDNHLLLI